jgi:hypothetical protein
LAGIRYIGVCDPRKHEPGGSRVAANSPKYRSTTADVFSAVTARKY